MSFSAISLIALTLSATGADAESRCYGTPANGRLERGVRLETEGPNFAPYSSTGVLLGRTYVHSKVAAVVQAAWEQLHKSSPGKIFVYGETGWSDGGRFKPHKTHQNGLSVDFMVPILDAGGKSVPLPTSVFNKFGYDLDFDARGRLDEYRIDFEAMADHIYHLHRQAGKVDGIRLKRVIFDPRLQPFLWKTKRGPYLKKHVTFSRRQAWVRHDEHYHADFEVGCKAL